MKKYWKVEFTALLAVIGLCSVALAAQKTTFSQREIRDPRQFERYLEENALDAETRIAAVEGAAQTTGAKVGATVTASEQNAFVNRTVLSLADTPVSVIYNGGATNAIGSTKIYDFPDGRILVLGVTVDSFDITSFPTNTMEAADGGAFSLGTAVPDADGELNVTAIDLCPSTAIDPITNVVNSALAASAQFDGTAAAKDMYINMSVDHGDLTGASTNALTVSGTVTINWVNLGDY